MVTMLCPFCHGAVKPSPFDENLDRAGQEYDIDEILLCWALGFCCRSSKVSPFYAINVIQTITIELQNPMCVLRLF